jgi:hypothetical protein
MKTKTDTNVNKSKLFLCYSVPNFITNTVCYSCFKVLNYATFLNTWAELMNKHDEETQFKACSLINSQTKKLLINLSPALMT